MSDIARWVRNRPRSRIRTSSTVCATSASTWLDNTIVRPSPARSRKRSRSHRIPAGSRPLAGSSRIEDGRVAEQRGRQREPLAHAERERARAAIGCFAQADELEDLADTSLRDARLGGQHPQMVARRAAAVKGTRLEDDPDLVGRIVQRGERPTADHRPAGRRGHQPQQHPQRRRLARAVGAEQADHPPRLDLEADVIDSADPPEVLRQRFSGDIEHGI